MSAVRDKILTGLSFVPLVLVCQGLAPYLTLDLPNFKKLSLVKIVDTPSGKTVHARYSNGEPMSFTISNQDGKISCLKDRSNPDFGSGIIGIIIIGMPGMLVASPIIILTWIVRGLIQFCSGRDIHLLALWLKLKNQLPEEVLTEVSEALR